MTTVDGLFAEFAAALQFPDYFGENWAAFKECLGDLTWLPPGDCLVAITNAQRVLEAEPADIDAFVRGVVMAGEEIHRCAPTDEWRRRPHVLLQLEEGAEGVMMSGLKRLGVGTVTVSIDWAPP